MDIDASIPSHSKAPELAVDPDPRQLRRSISRLAAVRFVVLLRFSGHFHKGLY
jgi:hypothetical protein